MPSFSLVVLISGNGSNLQVIIDQIACGYLKANIACVISNRPNAYGLKRAEKHNICHYALDHTQFESREAYDKAMIQLIKPHQPDCIVLAGYMRILSAEFFHQFTHKIINIHPSLLPKYQGLHTHKRALENKDSQHGVSVHIATEELDSGPVIAQASFDISTSDSIENLQQQCHKLEHILYPLIIKWIVDKHINISSGVVSFNNERRTKPLMLDQINPNEYPKQ